MAQEPLPQTPSEGRAVAALHSNERMAFFSDGIFAITITLLVLEVKVPEVESEKLMEALHHTLPALNSCILSFIVLGIYWIAHHNLFLHIKHHDHVLLWLNTLFMMCIALIPFPTGLISRYPEHHISLVSYAGILTLTGVCLNLIWWYANTRKLTTQNLDPNFVKFVSNYIRIAPIVYFLTIPVSFVSLHLAELMVILVGFYYVLPKAFHRQHYNNLLRQFDQ
jgi:uncharacterized membrane protein